jgi:predicted MFS family arabinose efflux permease
MKKNLFENKARLAVLLAFFTNGALVATWVSRIPVVQTKLGLSDGTLGLVLIGFSGGLLSALFLVGGLIGRYGSHKVTLACGLASCFALPFLVVSTHPIMLFAVLFLFGGSISSMDVAMNEQAVLVERDAGKPQMSSFHASYSIGGFAGALISAGMAAIPGSSALLHFVIVSLLFCAMIVLLFPHLAQPEREEGKQGAVFRLPERALWILGAVAFCSAIGEGAMADWGAVYLTQVLRTDAAFAALGFAAFSLTMTFGRLIGDTLSSKWSSAVIVRAGGLFAAVGILLAAFTKSPVVAMIGFSAAGFGLANIIPLLFGAAGNIPGIQAGAGIAGVATIGYAGFLAGPPLIGSIAEATSLRVALALVAVLVGTLVFSAKAISPKSKTG